MIGTVSGGVQVAVFEAPAVCVGDMVQWFEGGEPGLKPVAAVVVGVGDGGVCHLWLFDRYQPRWQDAVRHMGDPATANEGYRDRHAGCWLHIPRSGSHDGDESR